MASEGSPHVGERSDVTRLVASGASDPVAARVSGVWHTAGVLADRLLGGQSAATLRTVFGPKAVGGTLLHSATATAPLVAQVQEMIGG